MFSRLILQVGLIHFVEERHSCRRTMVTLKPALNLKLLSLECTSVGPGRPVTRKNAQSISVGQEPTIISSTF